MAVVYSLNMINNGANGKTQEVISKALGYTADDLDAINSLNRTMLIGQRKEETNVNNESMGYMITANFLMLHEQTKLLPDFQEALEHYYFTNIIDSANTPMGRESANKLCKTITKGEIQSLPINLTGPRAAPAYQLPLRLRRLGRYRSTKISQSLCLSSLRMVKASRSI